ncbi:MAG: hypothetical protein AB1813_22470, partial [Verrucomicrobiota bacterium]
IDHSQDELSDEFRCFALQHKSTVVGYLQYSYFREEHVFFFEYLCLRDFSRSGLLPSEATQAIADYLAQNYDSGFTLVFEVAQIRSTAGTWEPDTRLLTYFTRFGLRRVGFDYHYPILQSYEGEISYPADLMVLLPTRRTVVTASELRTILRCIYFKHYLRWDRPFLEPEAFSEREHLIHQLYSRQVAQISANVSFKTFGDDRRLHRNYFANTLPRIRTVAGQVFGPKLPRLIAVIGVLLVAQWILGSGWMLVPFVPAVAAIYCLAEDTDASRKLFVVAMSKLRAGKPRM